MWYSREEQRGKQRALDGRLAKSASAMKSPQRMQVETKPDQTAACMSLRGDGCAVDMRICTEVS